jgi:hypothetical protein
MLEDYLGVFNSVIALFINVITQILCLRYAVNGLLKSIFLGFTFGLLGLLTVQLYIASQDIEFLPGIMVNIVIYSLFGYCYFHFINLGETARRVRLLRELHESNGGLTLEEILKRYNAEAMVELRLQRLISSGQIILKDGRLHVGKPVLSFISKIIILMKLILLGRKSELDS